MSEELLPSIKVRASTNPPVVVFRSKRGLQSYEQGEKSQGSTSISNFTLRFDLIGKINAHADLKVIDYVTITIETGEYFSMLLSLALVRWADNDKRITLIVKKKQGKANFE